MSIALEYGEQCAVIDIMRLFVIGGTIDETGTSIRVRNSFHSSQ